jgi:putative ABC transport system permease protein
MFLYNVRIALKSIRRNPILSLMIVTGMGLGIGVSTTFITMHHVVSKNPIPQKSEALHYVRMDSWGPDRGYPGDVPPIQITYRDMQEIMKSDIPVRQSAMYKSRLYVFPEKETDRPFKEFVRLCYADFFPMFDVPFRYGSGWDSNADLTPEPVVVINTKLNQRLFGGSDSVGKTMRIEDRNFTVVGVLDRWRPSVRFYDMTQNSFGEPEAIFMPFRFSVEMEIRSMGNMDNWKNWPSDDMEGFLQSESAWLQMWVELEDEDSEQAYAEFLDTYALDQRQYDRFQRPLDNRLSTVTELMAEWEVVPEQSGAMMYIANLFLIVCALNLMGLLLGKFLAKGAEVGVRRALGASRLSVFLQHIVECEVIGLLGGVLGIGLSLLGLFVVNRSFPAGSIFHLDVPMVMVAVTLSLVAGLIAGLYPAWRICTVTPAMHLKLQ